ncbi:MAG: adenylate/guanylate cyclase domain-containing protein [Mycobacterium sp.]
MTVLFADVVGSMQLASALDAERLQEIMNELFNRAAAVVQRYRGTVDKFTGDGLMALFGAPVALEDHALRACIAAQEIRSSTVDLAAEVLRRDGVVLQTRIGLNSGDVIAGEIGSGPGRYTVVGHPVGIAQRMEASAAAGTVLCSLSTARLVEDATDLGAVVHVAVKGEDGLVPARELLAVESGRMVLGRSEGVLLGRDDELTLLRASFDARHGCAIGIVGSPGVGKSRLVGEFTTIARRDADIVLSRCEAHSTAIAFRAVSRLLTSLFGVEGLAKAAARAHTVSQYRGSLAPDSADAQILFEAMGIADAGAPQLGFGIDGRRTRLVGLMAQAVRVRATRTVFVIEDTHWIDAPSDDVLSEFVATLDATTSMFVTTSRPEFRGSLQRSSDQTITLQPLPESLAACLVGQILGDDRSLAGLAGRIAVVAVGNPFFVEEIVRELASRGALAGSRGAYRLAGRVDEIGVPATVQAVLAARIDRLPAGTKSILNAAAVIGNQFDIDTLQALRPETESSHLAELVSAELIDQTEFVPAQRYCFCHPLVRTVAYESQLSSTRVEAHGRLAAAIAARDPDVAGENATLIATHLEAACRPVEAYHWHMRAAEWLRPRDLPAARLQWESARSIADRLPDDDSSIVTRIAPRTLLTSTAFYVGDEADAEEQYREFRSLALQADDPRSLAIGTAGRIWSFAVNDNRVPEAAALASELETMMDGMDCDAATTSIVCNAVAFARFVNCEFEAALRVVEVILRLGDDAPADEVVAADALGGLLEMCLGNPERGGRRLRTATDQARELTSDRYAYVLIYWATAAALGLCQAEHLVEEVPVALRRAEAFGDAAGVAVAQWAYGAVLLRADAARHDEAIDVLRRAKAAIQEHGALTIVLASIQTDLAIDVAHHGQPDDAIDELRDVVSMHLDRGSRVFVGCPAEALVELLIERGAPDDRTEAHRIVGLWQARRPGIPALDLWWLRSRIALAKVNDDSGDYDELASQYLALCEKLDARGRLDEAHQMVNG